MSAHMWYLLPEELEMDAAAKAVCISANYIDVSQLFKIHCGFILIVCI